MQDINEVLIQYEPLMRNLAARNRVNGYNRDDLLQEFRMVLLRCHKKFDPKKATVFSTYLTKSCIYKVKELRMRERNQPLSLDVMANPEMSYLDYLEDGRMTPEEQDEFDRVMSAINSALDGMEKGHITKMYYLYDIPQTEIARIEGLSKGYVNKVNKRNIAKLKEILNT